MPRNFRIKHTQVGPFPEGTVVTEDELRRRGADLNHLLRGHPTAGPAIEVTDALPTVIDVDLVPDVLPSPLPIVNEFSGRTAENDDDLETLSSGDDTDKPPVSTSRQVSNASLPSNEQKPPVVPVVATSEKAAADKAAADNNSNGNQGGNNKGNGGKK